MEQHEPSKEQLDAFLEAAVHACDNSRKQGTFQCPVCMGTAIAMKSNVNGHIMASCPACKTGIRQ